MVKEATDDTSARAPSRAVAVFTPQVLDLLHERDEPATALEAEMSGPWRIVPLPDGGFGVARWGEPELGTEPYARFADRQLALLAAAGLACLARGGTFRVETDGGSSGYPLLREGEEVGLLRVFAADLAPVLDAFEGLLRSPDALARLLEAAGATALKRAGDLLGLRLVADQEPEAR